MNSQTQILRSYPAVKMLDELGKSASAFNVDAPKKLISPKMKNASESDSDNENQADNGNNAAQTIPLHQSKKKRKVTFQTINTLYRQSTAEIFSSLDTNPQFSMWNYKNDPDDALVELVDYEKQIVGPGAGRYQSLIDPEEPTPPAPINANSIKEFNPYMTPSSVVSRFDTSSQSGSGLQQTPRQRVLVPTTRKSSLGNPIEIVTNIYEKQINDLNGLYVDVENDIKIEDFDSLGAVFDNLGNHNISNDVGKTLKKKVRRYLIQQKITHLKKQQGKVSSIMRRNSKFYSQFATGFDKRESQPNIVSAEDVIPVRRTSLDFSGIRNPKRGPVKEAMPNSKNNKISMLLKQLNGLKKENQMKKFHPNWVPPKEQKDASGAILEKLKLKMKETQMENEDSPRSHSPQKAEPMMESQLIHSHSRKDGMNLKKQTSKSNLNGNNEAGNSSNQETRTILQMLKDEEVQKQKQSSPRGQAQEPPILETSKTELELISENFKKITKETNVITLSSGMPQKPKAIPFETQMLEKQQSQNRVESPHSSGTPSEKGSDKVGPDGKRISKQKSKLTEQQEEDEEEEHNPVFDQEFETIKSKIEAANTVLTEFGTTLRNISQASIPGNLVKRKTNAKIPAFTLKKLAKSQHSQQDDIQLMNLPAATSELLQQRRESKDAVSGTMSGTANTARRKAFEYAASQPQNQEKIDEAIDEAIDNVQKTFREVGVEEISEANQPQEQQTVLVDTNEKSNSNLGVAESRPGSSALAFKAIEQNDSEDENDDDSENGDDKNKSSPRNLVSPLGGMDQEKDKESEEDDDKISQTPSTPSDKEDNQKFGATETRRLSFGDKRKKSLEIAVEFSPHKQDADRMFLIDYNFKHLRTPQNDEDEKEAQKNADELMLEEEFTITDKSKKEKSSKDKPKKEKEKKEKEKDGKELIRLALTTGVQPTDDYVKNMIKLKQAADCPDHDRLLSRVIVEMEEKIKQDNESGHGTQHRKKKSLRKIVEQTRPKTASFATHGDQKLSESQDQDGKTKKSKNKKKKKSKYRPFSAPFPGMNVGPNGEVLGSRRSKNSMEKIRDMLMTRQEYAKNPNIDIRQLYKESFTDNLMEDLNEDDEFSNSLRDKVTGDRRSEFSASQLKNYIDTFSSDVNFKSKIQDLSKVNSNEQELQEFARNTPKVAGNIALIEGSHEYSHFPQNMQTNAPYFTISQQYSKQVANLKDRAIPVKRPVSAGPALTKRGENHDYTNLTWNWRRSSVDSFVYQHTNRSASTTTRRSTRYTIPFSQTPTPTPSTRYHANSVQQKTQQQRVVTEVGVNDSMKEMEASIVVTDDNNNNQSSPNRRRLTWSAPATAFKRKHIMSDITKVSTPLSVLDEPTLVEKKDAEGFLNLLKRTNPLYSTTRSRNIYEMVQNLKKQVEFPNRIQMSKKDPRKIPQTVNIAHSIMKFVADAEDKSSNQSYRVKFSQEEQNQREKKKKEGTERKEELKKLKKSKALDQPNTSNTRGSSSMETFLMQAKRLKKKQDPNISFTQFSPIKLNTTAPSPGSSPSTPVRPATSTGKKLTPTPLKLNSPVRPATSTGKKLTPTPSLQLNTPSRPKSSTINAASKKQTAAEDMKNLSPIKTYGFKSPYAEKNSLQKQK